MERIRQAGAIAIRVHDGLSRVLLVTARRDPTAWVFPKGHIEPGETPVQAALRELQEEAGVSGDALGSVGSSSFRSGDEDVDVEYFLVHALTDGAAAEGRRRLWLDPAAADAALSFGDARRLLDRALAMWREAR
jgi:diadenosine hexaphosphate hydrolase (ATP-forming)